MWVVFDGCDYVILDDFIVLFILVFVYCLFLVWGVYCVGV